MKALVTGSAGFIGSHLVDALLAKNYAVAGLDDWSSGDWFNSEIQDYKIDITTPSIEIPFSVFKPWFVFHQAAAKKVTSLKNPMRTLEVNAIGTLNVLRMCYKYNVQHLVYASTGSVYYPVTRPVTESSPTNPQSPYGISKLIGEWFCQFYANQGLNVTILRYFHVYGPRQRCQDDNGGVVGIFCRRALSGLPLRIHGDGTQVRTFTFVKDIVRANLLAVENRAIGKTYNVSSGYRMPVLGLANKIAERMSIITEYDAARQHDIKEWYVDNSAIKEIQMNGWTLFDVGLEQTFDWYKRKYA